MKIRGYMAMSVDGYIADADGGVGWLDPFNSVDYGFSSFFETIGTVVFGRRTYEQSLSFTGDWSFDKAYAGKRCIVVTSHSLAEAPANVEAWSDGVKNLAEALKTDRSAGGDAWIIGGAKLQAAFIDAGALDSLDLFVIPTMLGDGVRAFPRIRNGSALSLVASETLEMGMVRLSYAFSA